MNRAISRSLRRVLNWSLIGFALTLLLGQGLFTPIAQGTQPLAMASIPTLPIAFRSTAIALAPAELPSVEFAANSVGPSLDQAQRLYQQGNYTEAQSQLEALLPQAQGPTRGVILTNLSLVQQSQGQWQAAQASIDPAIALLQSDPSALAQAHSIRGRLAWNLGKPDQALDHWQQAERITPHPTAALKARLNQAQALQELGLSRRAIALWTEAQAQPSFAKAPASLQLAILQPLAETQLASGDLTEARRLLTQAQALPLSPQDQANLALSQGNLNRAQALNGIGIGGLSPAAAIAALQAVPETLAISQQERAERQQAIAKIFVSEMDQALADYQRAALGPNSRRAQLNQLAILISLGRSSQAQPLITQLAADLDPLLQSSLNHDQIYDQLNFSQLLGQLNPLNPGNPLGRTQALETRLQTLLAQAETLGDRRAQSHTLGAIGSLNEQTQNWSAATRATRQALDLAQTLQAPDLAYRWQWQLGRIYRDRGDRPNAISAYSQAVTTLQALRNDLVSVNRDLQFSFRETVEPVYRELVALLLQDDPKDPSVAIDNASATLRDRATNLTQARQIIEGLQVAELDNFFREACLATQFDLDRVVDRTDSKTAVLYTIVLPNHIDVVIKAAGKPLSHHATAVPQTQVETTIDTLLDELKTASNSNPNPAAAQLYDWLIRPAETALQQQGITTLVFVLDGSLRSVPMAALYDGKDYLIQHYGIAIAPGLQLPDPKATIATKNLNALLLGISEPRSGFSELRNVPSELTQIGQTLPNQTLLNNRFSKEAFQANLRTTPVPIVHIATHGQFSSNPDDTFLLAWDDRIRVSELNNLLRDRQTDQQTPIELLVLSACQTAAGDRRAALGLAGVAIQAGARSTIASLWSVDDSSSAELMTAFYQNYSQQTRTKAEALRQAQISLINSQEHSAPYYWAPFMLLGNWL